MIRHLGRHDDIDIVKEGGLWAASPPKALPNLKRQIVIPSEVEESLYDRIFEQIETTS